MIFEIRKQKIGKKLQTNTRLPKVKVENKKKI